MPSTQMPPDPKETDGFASPGAIDKLVPERTTEEVIADLVAREPLKHGVPIEVRKRLAALRVLQAGSDNDQYVYEEHCRSYGLDPDEVTDGRRPRYTMGENGAIKDHETGEIYGAPEVVVAPAAAELHRGQAEPLRADGGGRATVADSIQMAQQSGVTAPLPAECEHSFPEPLEASTPCTSCGITFEAYANS